MSTPVFVDPESPTQADGAQSSRVPVPLPEDPYEAIRQAYLDGTDTESEPFEDPIVTEIHESPLAIAPPISLSESTLPVLILILRRIARMAVRVSHAMSSGLSASMAEVAAMSEFALCKRFRSSYESLPSVSPPDLPSWKRYRGTSELVEDSKDNDDEEDGEIEESMDSDSMSKDSEDEDDERHGRDDESRGIDDEGHSVESDGLGLEEEEEDVLGGQQQAAPIVGIVPTLTTWTDPEDGMIYIDIPDYLPPAPLVQTPPLPEWTSGSLPISLSHSDVPSPISSTMVPLTVPSSVATPETEGFLTELGAQVKMQGGLICYHAVRLEELSPALFKRYDRDIRELFTRSGRLGMRFSPR
ncbi:hypothetical protein Tco_0811647, partial [Tanacetum coccineum]